MAKDATSTTVNPYSPPESLSDPDYVERDVRLSGAFANFPYKDIRIGVNWYAFNGMRVYTVNGEEALRTRDFMPWGTHRFILSEDDPREMEVRFRYFPFWTARVFLGDDLIVEELFPSLRWFFRILSAVLLLELIAVALTILFIFVRGGF